MCILRRSLSLWFILIAAVVSAFGDDYQPEVGQPHPDFVLPRIDNGQAVRLSQFRGKRVLLVHFASW